MLGDRERKRERESAKAHKRERDKVGTTCGGNWSLERMFYRQLLLLIVTNPSPKGWKSLGAATHDL